MTLTVETGRRQEVAAAAYRMRHHVLNMGEAQGQGYVGQALGAADLLAAVYADQRATGPRIRTGKVGIGSCCRPVTTLSGCTPRWASSTSTN